MTTLFSILIAIWLTRAIIHTLCGLLQILAGVAALVLCAALYALAGFLDIWNRLWRVAFC